MFFCSVKSWTICVLFVFKFTGFTGGSKIPLFQSNACYLTGECGLHWLGCPPNQRIALSSASHGFKPYSDACFHEGPGVDCLSLNTTYCCSEQTDKDCVLSYREQHLQKIYEKCSGNNACKTPPISVTDACYSMSRSEPASFSKVRYGCIKESNIANFCQREMVVGTSVSAVFKPNGLNMLYDKNCYCRIESATSAVIDVQVYAFDIRFKRSTSDTCSELSISKGRDTHGTVSTPRLPGEGFIHSFLPLINLTTPILTRLMLNKYALPDYVWLHFESITGDLRLKCGRDSSRGPPPCMSDIQPTIPSPKDFTPDPITVPKKYPPVIGVMIGVIRILFYEKTPIIGGGIAAVVAVLASLMFGLYLYKRWVRRRELKLAADGSGIDMCSSFMLFSSRRHFKKIKSVQPHPKGYNSPKQIASRGLSRVGSPKLGLGRSHNGSRELTDYDASSTSPSSPKEHSQQMLANTIAQKLGSDVSGLQTNIPNDANIIIVSRSSPSRNASVRSSCTCSSQHGRQTVAKATPPDVVLDSRAALQSVCNDLNSALTTHSGCSHNSTLHRNMGWCQGEACNHGTSACNHGHHGFCCSHEIQLRPDRLNSVASQVSIGTQIYGDPLPEVPEIPALPTRKKRTGVVLSHCIDENNPMYIVHNTKKMKENGPNSNRIWNWLKKCKPATKNVLEPTEDERPKKSSKREESSIEEVIINTSVTSPSVLPLPALPASVGRELPALPSRPSSVPSIAPPKRPPRLPTRAARHSLRNALKTMNEVYTQVANLPPKRPKMKPRVPRRRIPVYQDVQVAGDSGTKTPSVVDVTAPTESDSSSYANDYIMPVHASRGCSVRRGETSARYDEVSLDNETGAINFLHTVTLGLPPHDEEEEEETVGPFDRLKSVLWQSLMRFRGK